MKPSLVDFSISLAPPLSCQRILILDTARLDTWYCIPYLVNSYKKLFLPENPILAAGALIDRA